MTKVGRQKTIVNLVVLKMYKLEAAQKKLLSVIPTYNINLDPSDAFYNILTVKALSEKEATLFLQVEVIGQERYLSFVKEELEGSGSILDTLEKEKLRTYINNNKIVKVKTDNKDVQM